jgi:protein phosphatase
MMATTIVALHVDGLRASFAHVGDSRLYRLSPDGKLTRETEDHSIVEEEVRAGRMTPEQAANHPSKNVISRALGAESSVEVDTKTTDVQEGTTFLLCTDGITRHLPDAELRELLLAGPSAEAICAEMKQRCFQRGAEDNLTAVIVQVGTAKYVAPPIDDDSTDSEARTKSLPDPPPVMPIIPEARLTPPSRIAFPAPTRSQAAAAVATKAAQSSSGGGHPVLRFLVFLLFVVSVAGAFYGGMRYYRAHPGSLDIVGSPQPSPSPAEDSGPGFQQKRAAVDRDPTKWIAEFAPLQLAKEGIAKPIESKDSEFLYLYGRALMLSGNYREAMLAFERAVTNLRADPKVTLPLGTEVKLAEAAAALKLINPSPARSQESTMAEEKAARIIEEMLGMSSKEPAK